MIADGYPFNHEQIMRLLRKILRSLWNHFGSNLAFVAEYKERKSTQKDGRFYQQYAGCAEDEIGDLATSIRPIAFYLPQMHPIPENDNWWGKGFTEWVNVSKATPRFLGHYQPRLPGELGFYDLRCIDVMQRQVELAKLYGLHAFCFYYYWFNGKRLLERPLDMFLDNKDLQINFCVCWANENWTRRWDGLNSDVLIAQNYSEADSDALFEDWLRYFLDGRYLKVGGKPVVLIYRPDLIPEFERFSILLRRRAMEAGFPGLYLLGASAFNNIRSAASGLDGGYDFPPHNVAAPLYSQELSWLDAEAQTRVYSYEGAVEFVEAKYSGPVDDHFETHPGALVGWDNEARRPGRGDVYFQGSPALFRRWLRSAFERASRNKVADARFVFINAWNEWAEGAYLEPDRRHGYAYLAALRSVVREFGLRGTEARALCEEYNRSAANAKSDKVIILHLFYFDLLDEFAELVKEVRSRNCADLAVSFPDLWSVEQIEEAISKLRPRKAYVVANCGRDVFPFLVAARDLQRDGYQYGSKIHSKKSTHRVDGDVWRRTLLDGLLSSEAFRLLETGFFKKEGMGIAAPTRAYLPLDVDEYVAGNIEFLDRLTKQFGIDEGFRKGEFVAGTMFWFDFNTFAPVFEVNWTSVDFGPDLGQVDGTLAHAFERFFALYTRHRGCRSFKIAQTLGAR